MVALAVVVVANDPLARGVAAACVLWLFGSSRTDTARGAIGALVGGAIVVTLGALLLDLAAERVARPPFFDFLAMWLPARAATEGAMYDLVPSIELARALGASPEFLAQLHGGPSPPELLLLLPFGMQPAGAAAAWWMLLQLACLATAVLVLWTRNGPASPRTLVAVAALVLLLPATDAIVSLAAPAFLVLAAVAVWAVYPGTARGGAALALALLVRPPVALLLLLPTPGKRRELLAFLAVSVAIGLLVLAVLGSGVLAAYLASGPFDAARILDTQQVNQSLAGWTARLIRPLPTELRPLLWAGWIAVLAVTTHTLLSRRGAGRGTQRVCAAFAISALLLLDPGTLHHHLVLLAVAWLIAWDDRARVGLGDGVAAGLIGAGVAVSGVDGGALAILAPLGTWIALLAAIRVRGGIASPADDGSSARLAEPSGA